MKLTGAAIIVKTLIDIGVSDVFGYVGNSILPVFDEIEKQKSIKLYSTVSEAGAANAADGYSRASGKTGVVIATSGPGATNLVTGIATAYMDSVPLVAITGNVARDKLGKDSFQEVDITGIVTPITKYAHIISDVSELEYELKRAFAIAAKNRSAPVLIDVPYDILTDSTEYKDIEFPPSPLPIPDREAISAAADIINKAVRPLILIGGGGIKACDNIVKLANKINAPIVSTMRGVGAVCSDKYVGMAGSFGCKEANALYSKADAILAVGTRFSDRLYSQNKSGAKIIHIDIDSAELDKIKSAEVAVLSDADAAVTAICKAVLSRPSSRSYRLAQKSSLRGDLGKFATAVCNSAESGIILVTDVGSCQIAVINALNYKKPGEFINSAGLGTMGFSMGAAIGAAVATNKPVLVSTGDGGFNMSFQELATAVKYGLNITVVVGNNGCLDMIRKMQNENFGGRLCAVDNPIIDYVQLARALGAKGVKTGIKNLQNVIKKNICNKEVAVINVCIKYK